MVQRFGNEEVGEAAARAVRTQQYGLLALSEATRAQSPMLIAKARQELARGSMEQAQFKIAHEKLVQTGGGGIDLKAINAAVLAERSKRIAAGEPWDPAIEAKTRASITSGMYGRDIGAPEVPGMMQKGGAGPKAGRMARDLVKYESNTKALDELSRMSEKAGAGPMGLEDQRRASILQQSLEQNGVTIPGLGMVSRWTGGELAGIQAAKAQQQRQLEIARRVVATGGAGGGEEKDTSAADEGISEE
jgi:hypothetical protein